MLVRPRKGYSSLMHPSLLAFLTVLYGATGAVSLAAYFPTLRDLWHRKSSANGPSYILWTACNVVALLYGFFILKNLLFIIVTGFQLLACSAILILRLRLPK